MFHREMQPFRVGDVVRVIDVNEIFFGETGVVGHVHPYDDLVRVDFKSGYSWTYRTNKVVLAKEVPPAEMAFAITGDDRPAPNAEQWEEEMLRLLAKNDEDQTKE